MFVFGNLSMILPIYSNFFNRHDLISKAQPGPAGHHGRLTQYISISNDTLGRKAKFSFLHLRDYHRTNSLQKRPKCGFKLIQRAISMAK